MDTEDFSFPKIGDTCSYSIDSPPLWNISPKASSNPYQVLREGIKGDKKITRVDDEEVPMDLLWEVFNEQLPSTTEFATSSSREMVEFRCATALAVAKTSSALLQTKNRPGMLVIIKVLKKLFFLNNSQGKSKKF